MKKILSALPALLALATPAALNANTPHDFTAWPTRVVITFSGYAGQETLADFPALIRFDSEAVECMLPGAPDLRFSDDTGNLLSHEIDTWDDNSETWLVWVRVPALDSDTQIIAYFGNTSAEPLENPEDTWDEWFMAVQHFSDPDGHTVTNSTANGPTADIKPASTGQRTGNGAIGRAINLSSPGNGAGITFGVNDGPTPSSPSHLQPGNTWTASVWFNGIKTDSSHRTLLRGSQNHHALLQNSGDYDLGSWFNDPGGGFQYTALSGAPTRLSDGNAWRLLTVVGTGTSPNIGGNSETRFYLDGALIGVGNYNSMDSISHIGCWEGSQQFADFLDEVRVSNTARSADWIQAEYDTVAVPGFAAQGPVQKGAEPIVAAQSATHIRSVSANANGSLVHLGEGAAEADVYVYWSTNNTPGGPLEWGCAPKVLNGMGTGLFHFELDNLLPGTEYQYCFFATNTTDGAWSKTVLFKTRGSLADIEMLGAEDGLLYAAVDVFLDWAGETDAAGILLLYGTNNWGGVADAWLNDPGHLFVFRDGCGVGEHSFILPVPPADTPYFCRAFAINPFGTNAAPEGVVFNSLFALTSGLPRDWVWSGKLSTQWSNPGNWVNASTLLPPAHISELDGQNLLLGPGPFLPLDQNITGLAVNEMQVAALTRSFAVTGEGFLVTNRFNCGHSAGGVFEISFYNDIEIASDGGPWLVADSLLLSFHGTLSETPGVPKTFVYHSYLWDGATVHFYGPVLFSGGIASRVHFHHPDAVGKPANPANPAFYAGVHAFHLPAGMEDCEYDLPVENGFSGGHSVVIADKVMVVLNAPLTHDAAHSINVNGNGILVLNAADHPGTGGINLHSGLVIIKGELPPGGMFNHTYGSIDLDGQDLLGRDLVNYMYDGYNMDGYYRNQNPDRESTVSGNLVNEGQRWSWQFGGVGKMRFTGDVVDGGRFVKTGPGTLTLAGAFLNDNQAPTHVMGGTLVLDHSATNAAKIGTGYMSLAGNVALLGNALEDTVQTVGNLDIGVSDNHAGYNRARVSIEGRGGRSATFRFGGLYLAGGPWDTGATVDFAPGDKGFILSKAENNPVLNTFPARVTFKGESFARVPDGPPDLEGYRAVEPLPDGAYLPDFAAAQTNSFVDIALDTATLANVPAFNETWIAALRFSANAAVTLTLDHPLRLLGEQPSYSLVPDGNDPAITNFQYNTHGYSIGGILVTPNVGDNEVVIDGPHYLNQRGDSGIVIHQYNTNAALVLNAPVSASTLIKTGPGELVINHPSTFFWARFYLYEGALSFSEPRDFYSWLLLGDATLRFTGPGHVSPVQIGLGGFGVVEASGGGPLVLAAHPVTFTPSGPGGGNRLLTLSGETEGVVEGELQLYGGRLRKRGPGTWTLTETSHSPRIIWGAEIFEGLLVLNGTLGYDVTVHAGGTLSGTGRVHRDLIVKNGGALSLDPNAEKLLEVGKNLVIENGAKITLPKKLPTAFTPVLKVNGNITGEFEKPYYAHVDYANGRVSVRYRPTGTLLMVR